MHRQQHLYFAFLWSFIAFVALVVVRMYWLQYAYGESDYFFNQIPMINNNDGYYYAEGARDFLAGFHQEGDLSPIHAPLSVLTALIASMLPFAMDWVILLMPAIFGSLIAFPVYFILYRFIIEESPPYVAHLCAFFGAFFSGIVVSYYNRTMVGYYDTDMLLLVFVCFFYGFFFNLFEKQTNTLTQGALALIFGALSCW